MKIYLHILTCIYLFIGIVYSNSKCSYEEKCDKGKPGMINVHIIPHTHNDPGWLKNVDEYYVGSNKNITLAGGVETIIDSVLQNLEENPDRKFSYAEGAFIYRWIVAHPNQKRRMQRLIDNGQLEILLGGWVMNDEACTHYNDIINQMTLGLKMYRDTFGECAIPEIGWQVDVFGQSAAYADLLAKFGFSATFFGRVSDDVKYVKLIQRQLEFLWSPLPDFSKIYDDDHHHHFLTRSIDTRHSKDSNIFVSILPNIYQPPMGFCFDILCQDDPIQDDIHMTGYNVPQKLKAFLDMMLSQAKCYDTNHVIVTMGNDFTYQAAQNWYTNLDKLIKYVNLQRSLNDSDIRFNVMYSTPGCYMYALRNAKIGIGDQRDQPSKPTNLKSYTDNNDEWEHNKYSQDYIDEVLFGGKYGKYWPAVRESTDFFPLVNYKINVWTGYYASRPTFKGMIRDTSRFLQICKQVQALSSLNIYQEDVTNFERSQALAQHHDAITGTAKQAVTYDYIKRLRQGQLACQSVIEEAFRRLLVIKPKQVIHFCPLLNISVCRFTQTNTEYDVLLFNPLAWDVEFYVNLPIRSIHIQVRDVLESPIDFQISTVPSSVIRVPERYSGENRMIPQCNISLTFLAQVPALGTVRYSVLSKIMTPVSSHIVHPFFQRDNEITNQIISNYLTPSSTNHITDSPNKDIPDTFKKDNLFMENKVFTLVFDPDTKQMALLTNKVSDIEVRLNQSFYWYGQSSAKSSDAYLFRSNALEANNISSFSNGIQLKIIKGTLFDQARQIFSPWLYQDITLYKNANYLDMAWTVGSIPIHDKISKDIVMRIDSDIASSVYRRVRSSSNKRLGRFTKFNKFYTDSNARFMMPRSVANIENITTFDYDLLNFDQANMGKMDPYNFIPKQYYPVNSKIFIKDEKKKDTKRKRQLGIVNDRSQGGTSLKEGSIELMVHRRMVSDAGLGVDEVLNETGSDGQGLIARGKHLLVFDTRVRCNKLMTKLAQTVYLSPQIMFLTPDNDKRNSYNNSKLKTPRSFLIKELPANLHLLSLYQWGEKRILLRLEHIYSPGEHPQLSKPVTIDLKRIFSTFTVESLIETTLGCQRKIERR
ncbi:unnamed protein product [Gordionus sp. m RMFG-2023]